MRAVERRSRSGAEVSGRECVAGREVSDLKLVIEAFPLFAIPDRILNLGNRVAF